MPTFDDLALAYDSTIDWKSRLDREIPFLVQNIGPGKKHVLDMACGSGRHAVALSKKGYAVQAFDNSSSMINAAKELSNKAGTKTTFIIANMMDISEVFKFNFDAIICLGNSLALLPDLEVLSRVISSVGQLLSDNGVFIFQTLNFDEIDATGFASFDSKTAVLDSGNEVIFSRQFEHPSIKSETTTLRLSTMVKENTDWQEVVSRQKVLRLNIDILTRLLSQSGLAHLETYSDYAGNTFQKESSRNIVMVARKKN